MLFFQDDPDERLCQLFPDPFLQVSLQPNCACHLLGFPSPICESNHMCSRQQMSTGSPAGPESSWHLVRTRARRGRIEVHAALLKNKPESKLANGMQLIDTEIS